MEFTHLDEKDNVKMVDISEKGYSFRLAEARGRIFLNESTARQITEGNMKKGNVLTTAKIAGICAAKKTYETIPLCHQIQLTKIDIDFIINLDNVEIISVVGCIDKTGAEMEALNAVTVAALTIYDMCKAVDKNMRIEEIRLWEKSKRSV
ncbi:MAG TPA: cyclic pyranopterin monophosphate synthase MoaC [Spirochaetota bacterium]|nr:cyclic pyranopterin monophosphate synthase MoaC [Spirochaetota bacterium]